MIITRTPLRITLGGGGTDLPSYYERFGGVVLSAAIDNYVKELGLRSQAALEDGDCERYAALMHEHWEHKKKRSGMMSNPNIDRWYSLGRENGALGGKLVGAGAGGFLLFYTQEPRRLRSAMVGEGLAEVRFSFDNDGSVVLVRS
jgi:D-glycero-alpha-D-manno-heptose-7-phosphate kinase